MNVNQLSNNMKFPSLHHCFFKIVLCVFFLVFITDLNAQASYKITYHISETIPSIPREKMEPRIRQVSEQINAYAKNVHFILRINNNHSFFEMENSLDKTNDSYHDKMLFSMARTAPSFNKEVYADYNESSIVFIRNLATKDYTVKRDFYDFNWQIEEETKQILGLEARKAKGNYIQPSTHEEMDVEAWFIPTISLQSGPDIFMGLPGLIAEVHLKQAVVTAIKIESNSNLEIKKIKDSKAMSQQELEELIIDLTEKYLDN